MKLPHVKDRWPIDPWLTVYWEARDGGRAPSEPTQPEYPNGIDVDLIGAEIAAGPTCAVRLPPVPDKLGLYYIGCARCGLRVGITVAGRADDPRTVRIPCGSSRAK